MPLNPLNPSLPEPAAPLERLYAAIAQLERRLQGVERLHPEFIVVEGARTDLAGGRGPRVRFGLLTDSNYGVERWTSAGARQVPTWS